jgi:biopolymer transport protein ExbD
MKRIKKLIFIAIVSISLLPLSPISLPTQNTPVTVEASTKKSTTVYVTRTGKKYHKKKCGNGKYYKSTLKEAKKSWSYCM